MSKRSRLPQSRHHILVYDEDWTFLKSLFGPEGPLDGAELGIGNFIRELVHKKCTELRARYHAKLDALPPVELGAPDTTNDSSLTA